ncbi:hypothetical protein FNF27_01257 [Cafeteria roenbergensis]|uniref:C2H2-type domain-containing protein n=1 Tax=Cafeteria roenbergensis TaxID=33653 RepID=A0A5A8D6P5_CAFRO|nr:hypothetical protein FNF31_04707 [Cafeteria roenbergensis]KAA0177480.1 hypothetical protein FNF27_01257 [Cafeteria roenbergensis]
MPASRVSHRLPYYSHQGMMYAVGVPPGADVYGGYAQAGMPVGMQHQPYAMPPHAYFGADPVAAQYAGGFGFGGHAHHGGGRPQAYAPGPPAAWRHAEPSAADFGAGHLGSAPPPSHMSGLLSLTAAAAAANRQAASNRGTPEDHKAHARPGQPFFQNDGQLHSAPFPGEASDVGAPVLLMSQPYGLAYAPHHAHAPGADSHQFAAHAGAYGRPGAPEHGGWPGSLAAGPAHGMPDHATAHHGDDDSTTAGPGGARASEFNLDSCGPFRCGSHLNRHMRGCHTRDHRWSCEECGKSFSSLSNRDAHIRSVHRKTRPFVCKACPRAFSRRTHLRVHCRKVHGVDIGSRTHTVTWKDIHRLAAGGTADSDLAGHGGASRAHEEEQDEEDDDDDTHSGRTSRDGEASHDREGALGPSQDGPHGAKSVLVPTGGVLPVVPSMSSHRAAMGSTMGSHGYHTSASADVHGVFGRLQHASSPTGAASSANTASTAVSETGEPGCEPSARARVITICPPNLSSPGLDAALPTSSRG